MIECKDLNDFEFNDLVELSFYVEKLYNNFCYFMDDTEYLHFKNALRHILEILEKDNGI